MEGNILIVDDDSRNIFALTAVLKSKGFKTIPARDMDEALTALRSHQNIKIILLDMMMPGMDGYDGIQHLRSNSEYKNIPVIAVTAQAMAGDREKCLAAGADEYVSKPVDIDILFDILNRHLK